MTRYPHCPACEIGLSAVPPYPAHVEGCPDSPIAENALDIGGFIVGADQVSTVAQYAREWAVDCEWAEACFDELEEYISGFTEAQLIRSAARHYDGGIKQLVADAIRAEGTFWNDPSQTQEGR